MAFKGEILGVHAGRQAELNLAQDKLMYQEWVPFGSGPHSCPGEELAKMETKIFIAELLQNYKITLADTQSRNVEKVALFTLKLSGDVSVNIEPR